MSKFNISYNIIASDRFSKIARSVEKQALKMQGTISKVIDDNIDRQTRLGRSYAKVYDIAQGYSRMPKIDFTSPLNSFNNYLNKVKIMSFASFRRMMYTALPFIAIFKEPFKDLAQEQRLAINLTNQIGQSGAKSVEKISQKLSKLSTFKKVDIMSAGLHISQLGGGQNLIKKLMPVITDMAANVGKKPLEIAQDLSNALKSKDRSMVGGLLVEGSTVQDRLSSIMSQFNKIKGTAFKQVQTPVNKLGKSLSTLSESFKDLLSAAQPTFSYLATIISTIASSISNFSHKYKNLSKIIVGVITVSVGLIAVLLTLRAVQLTVVMACTSLITLTKVWAVISKGAAIATGVLRTAMLLLNVAFLANPIGVVIGLLVALGGVLYILYSKFEFVRKSVNFLFGSILDGVKAIAKFIGGSFSFLIKKMVEGVALLLHGVGYFSPTAEKWANSLDKVTNSWDKMSNAQAKVIKNQNKMQTPKGINNIINYQDIINRSVGINDSISTSNINNVNVHLYQNDKKVNTINNQGKNTSVWNIDNTDVYNLGEAMGVM